jgi:hypothetical protein
VEVHDRSAALNRLVCWKVLNELNFVFAQFARYRMHPAREQATNLFDVYRVIQKDFGNINLTSEPMRQERLYCLPWMNNFTPVQQDPAVQPIMAATATNNQVPRVIVLWAIIEVMNVEGTYFFYITAADFAFQRARSIVRANDFEREFAREC